MTLETARRAAELASAHDQAESALRASHKPGLAGPVPESAYSPIQQLYRVLWRDVMKTAIQELSKL